MKAAATLDDRLAFSLRGLERRYGVSRNTIAAAIHRRELRASRPGSRRFVVLRSEFEDWLHHRGDATDAAWLAEVQRKLDAT